MERSSIWQKMLMAQVVELLDGDLSPEKLGGRDWSIKMEKLPPVEYLSWPAKLGKPTFQEIVEVTRQVLGVEPGSDLITGKVHGCRQKDPLSLIWRHMAFSVARSIKGVSTIEFTEKIGLSSHTNLADRGYWFTRLRESNAGVSIHNEVVYCLIRKRRCNYGH